MKLGQKFQNLPLWFIEPRDTFLSWKKSFSSLFLRPIFIVFAIILPQEKKTFFMLLAGELRMEDVERKSIFEALYRKVHRIAVNFPHLLRLKFSEPFFCLFVNLQLCKRDSRDSTCSLNAFCSFLLRRFFSSFLQKNQEVELVYYSLSFSLNLFANI